MKTKFVIVSGYSAVGKKTLIRRLLCGDPALCAICGVTGKVYATGYSFDDFVPKKFPNYDTVIVQWQIVEDQRIDIIKRLYPDSEIKIFWLVRDLDEHYQDHDKRFGKRWKITKDQFHKIVTDCYSAYFKHREPLDVMDITEFIKKIKQTNS